MTKEIIYLGLLAAIGFVITFVMTFPSEKLSVKLGAVEMPSARKVHTKPLPYLGGASMVVAFLVAMPLGYLFPPLSDIYRSSSQIVGVALGALVVFIVGQLDDILDMSAPAKLAGQVLGAVILYGFGDTLYQFKVPFAGFLVLSSSFLPLITALWVIAIANAINLIDGLDGLAAGVVAIASASLCIYGIKMVSDGYLDPSNMGPLVAAICCGISLGFLPRNFNPAKIIMGDAGALFLGTLLAISTMLIGGRMPDVSGETFFFFEPLFIPFIILGVPMLDMVFAIVRRAATGKSFAHADKDHLHHRLLRLGHGQRRAVTILWAWTALLSGFVLYPTFDPHGNKLVPLGLAVLAVSLYTWFKPGLGGEGAKPIEADSDIADDLRLIKKT